MLNTNLQKHILRQHAVESTIITVTLTRFVPCKKYCIDTGNMEAWIRGMDTFYSSEVGLAEEMADFRSSWHIAWNGNLLHMPYYTDIREQIRKIYTPLPFRDYAFCVTFEGDAGSTRCKHVSAADGLDLYLFDKRATFLELIVNDNRISIEVTNQFSAGKNRIFVTDIEVAKHRVYSIDYNRYTGSIFVAAYTISLENGNVQSIKSIFAQ